MTREQLQEFVLDIIGFVDYDLAKNYDPETAEEPEYAEEELTALLDHAEEAYKRIND